MFIFKKVVAPLPAHPGNLAGKNLTFYPGIFIHIPGTCTKRDWQLMNIWG